jgi:hypothetical protein
LMRNSGGTIAVANTIVVTLRPEKLPSSRIINAASGRHAPAASGALLIAVQDAKMARALL